MERRFRAQKRKPLERGKSSKKTYAKQKKLLKKNKIRQLFSFYCVSFAFLVRSFPLNRANDILDFPRDLCTTPPTTMTYHD